MSTRTGMPPAIAIARACCSPSSPAAPVITATHPVKSKGFPSSVILFQFLAFSILGVLDSSGKLQYTAGGDRFLRGQRQFETPYTFTQVNHRFAPRFHAVKKMLHLADEQLIAVQLLACEPIRHVSFCAVQGDRERRKSQNRFARVPNHLTLPLWRPLQIVLLQVNGKR